MDQFVIQIKLSNGWLAKSFEVGPSTPIPVKIPEGRVQVVMTNRASFDGIMSEYKQYGIKAVFSYLQEQGLIDCNSPTPQTFPIN